MWKLIRSNHTVPVQVLIIQPCLIYWNQSLNPIIQPDFTCVVGQIHPFSLAIMPRNQPNKRGRSKSVNKNLPGVQKLKTTAKGKGDVASTSDKQIVPALASTEGVTPTGDDKSVGQSVPPPSTTTSKEQIVQSDPTGDQPSTGKRKSGGETVEDIIPSEQGGSKEVDQPSTDDPKVGEDSVGVNISSKQGGEVGVTQGVTSDQGGSKEVASELVQSPPTTTDANNKSIVAAASESKEAIPHISRILGKS